MKVLSLVIPCYNAAPYIDTCMKSLLSFADSAPRETNPLRNQNNLSARVAAGTTPHRQDDESLANSGSMHGNNLTSLDDSIDTSLDASIEIIAVDDGSTDGETARKLDEWQQRFPHLIHVVHKENGGHGSAVNAGLQRAQGLYFKVVDADDWLDTASMRTIMQFIYEQAETEHPVDLIVGNYVYEKVYEHTQTPMGYTNVFPQDKIFTWSDINSFRPSQYLLMHSVIYRTQLLHDVHLQLPEHCFYVDNIFVYVPLVAVKTIRYFNVDMYRYFIGREGQSVNEDIMKSRIDQHIRVTKLMIDTINLDTISLNPKLRKYMENYLAIMFCICSVFLRMINTTDSLAKLDDVWLYLKEKQPVTYPHIRKNIVNVGMNLPGKTGRAIGMTGYRIAQKLFNFN